MSLKPEYPVVLRPLSHEDGGGWIALVPDLPGCMSDGPTAFDALTNVNGAIEEWKLTSSNSTQGSAKHQSQFKRKAVQVSLLEDMRSLAASRHDANDGRFQGTRNTTLNIKSKDSMH